MIYRLVRWVFRMGLLIFFRRVEVEGLENVPTNGPVLLVSNHTNALIDPLLIIRHLRRPVSLTAKSTLRKNPLLALLMKLLNVVPFHRREDVVNGADPKQNLAAFADVLARLKHGACVCIFPEGKSHSDPQIRAFKTGAARIALGFHDQVGVGLKIVPVGLYFEQKDRFRSAAYVGFGSPIDVADVRPTLGSDPARALTGLLEDRVRQLTLNFERRSRSDLYQWTARLIGTGGAAPAPLGRERRGELSERIRVVRRLQEGYDQLRKRHSNALQDLEARVSRYQGQVDGLGIDPHEVFILLSAARAAFFVLRELELLVVGVPIAAWGLINHFLPFQLTCRLARKLTEDDDQFASNAVFTGFLLFPLFFFLQVAAVTLLLPSLWLVIYLVTLPYSGAYVVLYLDRAGSSWRRTRTFLRFLRERDLQRNLVDECQAILSQIYDLNQTLAKNPGRAS